MTSRAPEQTRVVILIIYLDKTIITCYSFTARNVVTAIVLESK